MRRNLYSIILVVVLAIGAAAAEKPGFRIAGKIVNGLTGDPISGAKVELGTTRGEEWMRVVRSDSAGRFFFDGLKAGKYQLHGEYPGFYPKGFDQHGVYLSAIVVGGAVDSEHLVFRLEPACSISGYVTDEYNEPVRDAQVFLFSRAVENGKFATRFAGQDRTDDRGHYLMAPLEAGTKFIAVAARPWYAQVPRLNPQDGNSDDQDGHDVAFPTTFYPGTTEQNDAAPIELRPGEAVTANISLRSVRSAKLRIQSANTTGNVSAWVSQKIFDEFEMPTHSQTSFPSQGNFVITGFSPGRYTVHFRGGDQPDTQQDMDINGDMTLDGTAALSITNARIEGLARAEGAVLKDAFVTLRNRDTERRMGSPIAADGKFKMESVPPGKYEIAVANPASLYLVNMAASGAKLEGRTLTVPSAGDVRIAMILAKGVGHIEGTALTGDKGVPGALVLLVPEKPDEQNALFRRDQSDSDGTFTLPDIVPGRYTLVAIEDGWQLEWLKPEVLNPYLAKGEPVTIQPGGRYTLKVNVQKLITGPKMMVGH